jgi:prepilin-type N-terminal cleavage/methylation domain-containing protein
MKIILENRISPRRRAFTLIELLVVISIIAVLAALIIPVAGSVIKARKIKVVQAELQQIETALENYKAKYGVYPPGNPTNSLVNQLYYELSGVATNASGNYQTLDAAYTISTNGFIETFDVGGIVNCSRGSGEDAVLARDFLPGLKPAQITTATNSYQDTVVYLATSVGGPDAGYTPGLIFSGNPFRYAYPGTNNPNSYDLWVQLSINSTASNPKHYLICNWSQQVQVNSPLP